MVKNPLISIVVPSYNVAPYIRQCIESILNQTFSNWELLLVEVELMEPLKFVMNMLLRIVVLSRFMTIKG